jgi:hypothetical protein
MPISRAVVLAACLLCSICAMADPKTVLMDNPPPARDGAWCMNISAAYLAKDSIKSLCRQDELKARGRLIREWNSWPDTLKKTCEAQQRLHSAKLLACLVTGGKTREQVDYVSHDIAADCNKFVDKNWNGGITAAANRANVSACFDAELHADEYLGDVRSNVPLEIVARCSPMNQAPAYRRFRAWAECIRPLYEAYRRHPAEDAITLTTH